MFNAVTPDNVDIGIIDFVFIAFANIARCLAQNGLKDQLKIFIGQYLCGCHLFSLKFSCQSILLYCFIAKVKILHQAHIIIFFHLIHTDHFIGEMIRREINYSYGWSPSQSVYFLCGLLAQQTKINIIPIELFDFIACRVCVDERRTVYLNAARWMRLRALRARVSMILHIKVRLQWRLIRGDDGLILIKNLFQP